MWRLSFDREEDADHGSSAYIQSTGRENIDTMVNLDMWLRKQVFTVAKETGKQETWNPVFR